MPDTGINPPIQMPPGFDELPTEERLFIVGNKGNPEMMAVYQSTKIMQLHQQHSKMHDRIESLEKSRSRIKWTIGGAFAVILFFKAIIIAKWTKLIG